MDDDFSDSEPSSVGKKKKSRINRANKTCVVFDTAARKDFLTGFRKRKNARRQVAKEQMEKELREEIKKAKEKAKNRLAAAYELEKNRDTVLKDIADLVPSSVQDTGTHTISVTHIDSLSKLNSDQTDPQSDEEENSGGEGEPKENEKPPKPVISKKSLKEANKVFLKNLHSSKAYKNSQKQSKKGSGAASAKDKTSKLKGKKTAKTKRMRHHHPKKIVGNKSGRK